MNTNSEDIRRQQAILDRIDAIEASRRRRVGYIAGSTAAIVLAAVVIKSVWVDSRISNAPIQPVQVVASTMDSVANKVADVPRNTISHGISKSNTLLLAAVQSSDPVVLESSVEDPALPVVEDIEVLLPEMPLQMKDADVLAEAAMEQEQLPEEVSTPAHSSHVPRHLVAERKGGLRGWFDIKSDSQMDGTTLSIQII